jgi:hypothetical protein
MILTIVARGAAAGLAGGAVMTAIEKAEQALTGRPSSYVPGRTLAHLIGLAHPDRDVLARTWRCTSAPPRPAGCCAPPWQPRTSAEARGRSSTPGCCWRSTDAGERHRRRGAAADVAARRARHRRRPQGDLRVRDRSDRRRAGRSGARDLGGTAGAATAAARIRVETAPRWVAPCGRESIRRRHRWLTSSAT